MKYFQRYYETFPKIEVFTFQSKPVCVFHSFIEHAMLVERKTLTSYNIVGLIYRAVLSAWILFTMYFPF